MGDRDDPDDIMETSLTIDYDKQWLNCVSAIGPNLLSYVEKRLETRIAVKLGLIYHLVALKTYLWKKLSL